MILASKESFRRAKSPVCGDIVDIIEDIPGGGGRGGLEVRPRGQLHDCEKRRLIKEQHPADHSSLRRRLRLLTLIFSALSLSLSLILHHIVLILLLKVHEPRFNEGLHGVAFRAFHLSGYKWNPRFR